MKYKASVSQKEILRLSKVLGEEVNTLAFSILFAYHGDDKLLLHAENATYHQFNNLKTVIIDQQNVLMAEQDMTIVRPVCHFDQRADFKEEAEQLSAQALCAEKQCAEIIPVIIANEEEGFFIRIHHAIADGWAVSILIHQLYRNYIALLAGDPVPEREDIPYKEFVDAEDQYLSSPRSLRDGKFWKEFLDGFSESHLLSNNSAGNFTSKRITLTFAPETVQKLIETSADKGRTVQSLLFSVIAIAYRRLEGESRFCLGTFLLNRLNSREQNIFGNCFTTVPIPVAISDSDTFQDLNDKLSDSLFAVMRRQRTSYSLLVSQAFDDIPARPLFDTLISYQDYSGLESSGMTYTWYAPACQLETLQIGIVVRDSAIEINYDYRPDCIQRDKIQVLHSQITAALEEVLQNGWSKRILDFKQIPTAQMNLLETWNQTDHPYPEKETLYSLFEKQLMIRGNQPALYCGSESLSYSAFEQRVRSLASCLICHHVEPGQIIGVMMERSFDLLIAIYAVIRCGAAYMPIGLDTPPDRVSFMLRDSQAPVVLTRSWQIIDVPEQVCRIDMDDFDYAGNAGEQPEILASPDLPAYVIYTSGSTGTPKGVLIAHHSIVDRIHWMNRFFGMDQRDVVLQKTPYTFDVSVWELFWWSGYGGTLAILPPEAHKDPEQIIQAVEQYHVTKMHFVPSMLSAFLSYVSVSGSAGRLGSLNQVFASGEALMPAQVTHFYQLIPEAELINLYGPTECTVDVSYYRCPNRELASVPIGKPVDNTQLYVLDQNLEMLPIGMPGELCVAGNLVGIGYLNRPELTEQRFVSNPFGTGKMYRTGDLACWNTAGEVEYLGRMDNQVKLRGQRIELGEIEHRLSSIPGVRDAIATVQAQDNGESVLVAYYTGDCEHTPEQIREILSAGMPEYMVPQAIMHLEELPLSANGKADRKRLPKIALEHTDGIPENEKPVTVWQTKICAAFARVLQCAESDVGIRFNFFEHGGTSLLAIMLMTELLEECRVQLKDIYNHPTPEKLAALIEQGPAPEPEEDYSAELPYAHVEALNEPNPGIGAGKGILITGTTGFLGVHLLNDLIKRFENTNVFCLVRDADKLEKHWCEMFPDELFPSGRIICVLGDLTKPHLGLSPDDYLRCAERVAAVYHCAADVRHFGQWETSYAVNTKGTENIIDFCLTAGASLHHVSTMSVNGFILTTYGEKLSDTFAESNLFVGQRFKENVYVHSKYLAEKAVLDARKRGLKANIYRVGNLLWRDRDGRFQKNREAHDFYMITHASLELHAIPQEFSNLLFDMTAVDLCAEAIGTLSAGKLGNIFHMMNPYQITLIRYLKKVSTSEMRLVPLNELEHRLRTQPNNPCFGFVLPYLLANKQNRIDSFPVQSCDQTVKALEQMGFHWKVPTIQYMKYAL